MRRCPQPPESMGAPELSGRLHDLAEVFERKRAKALERPPAGVAPGSEAERIGLGALADDALILHVLGDVLEEAAGEWPTAIAAVARRVSERYEEHRHDLECPECGSPRIAQWVEDDDRYPAWVCHGCGVEWRKPDAS